MAVHCLRMLPKQTDKDIMDRKEAIKFKLMPDGVIRAHDNRYGCGISEWHIITPPIIVATIKDRIPSYNTKICQTIRSNTHGAIPHFVWIEPMR